MVGDMIEISVDFRKAEREVSRWADAVEDGGKRAVSQLSVLAEGHMKREAPEGSGFNPPSLRDSIEARPPLSVSTRQKKIMPWKKTQEGWPLVHAIVEGTDPTSYRDERPPAGPLIDWAEAKLGRPGVGWYLQEKIFREGHETFPNRFVSRSQESWEGEIEEVAGEAVREAFA